MSKGAIDFEREAEEALRATDKEQEQDFSSEVDELDAFIEQQKAQTLREGEVGSRRFHEQLEETGEPAPAWRRFLGALSGTDKGKLSFLVKSLGPTNVNALLDQRTGEIKGLAWRENEKAPWRPFNRPGFDVGDIAEQAPAVLQGLPSVILQAMAPGAKAAALAGKAAPLAGALVRGAIGDVAGSGARELAAEAVSPEARTAREHAVEVGESVASGALSELGLRGLGRAAGAASPYRRLQERIAKEPVRAPPAGMTPEQGMEWVAKGGQRSARDVAAERLPIAQKEGVPLTAGEASSSYPLKRIEGWLRRTGQESPTLRAFEQRALAAYTLRAQRAAETVAGGEASASKAGRMFAESMDDFAGKFQDVIQDRFAEGFERAKGIAGAYKGVPLPNVTRLVSELRAEAEAAGAGTAREKVAKYGEDRILGRLKSVGGNATASIEDIQGLLRAFREMGSQEGYLVGITKDVQEQAASRLMGAINRDIDEMIDTGAGGLRAEALGVLRDARATYRADMDELKAIKSTLVSKALKLANLDDYQQIMSKLMADGIEEDKVRMAAGILSKHYPETMANIRGAALEWVTRGRVSPTSELTGEMGEAALGLRSPGRALEEYGKNRKRLDSLFAGDDVASKNSRMLFHRIMDLSQAKGARSGTEGSPTAPNVSLDQWIGKLIGWMPGYGALKERLQEQVPIWMTKEKLARIITDPEQTKLLLQLTTAKKSMGASAIARLATRALLTIGREATTEEKKLTEQEMKDYLGRLSAASLSAPQAPATQAENTPRIMQGATP